MSGNRFRDARGRFGIDPAAWWDPRTWNADPTSYKIWLNAEQFAWVSAEDHSSLARFLWYSCSDGHTKTYARTERVQNGHKLRIYMHRLIATKIGPPPSNRHTYVDHVDGDGLNNRRSNLRWSTPEQNSRNRYGRGLSQGDLFVPIFDHLESTR